MVLNGEIRKLIFEEGSTEDIRRAAIANGMHTLAMDGTRKALQGLTTPEEVLRIAKADEH
jgi:general secretion pathway protein E